MEELKKVEGLFKEWRRLFQIAMGISSGCGCTPFYADAHEAKQKFRKALVALNKTNPEAAEEFEAQNCLTISGWEIIAAWNRRRSE